MKTICTFNSKGGVGKTTLTKELSIMFREAGVRVLCIDLDGQKNLSRHFLPDVDSLDAGAEVLFNRTLSPSGMASGIYASPYKGIDVIPATDKLAQKGAEIVQAPGGQSLLRRALAQEWLKAEYDVVLVDVPPTLIGIFLFNALAASDWVLVPMELSQNAMDGLTDTFELLAEVREYLNPSLKVLGVVINKYAGATKIANNTILEKINDTGLDEYVFQSRIRQATAVVQAENARAFVTKDAAGTTVAMDFRSLFSEIQERMNKQN